MEPSAYEEMYQLEESHWWYQGMRQISAGLLASVLDKRSDLQILDAGCGTGINLEALRHFGNTTGFDYSALALEYAAQRNENRLARASVEALPYANNHFDLVTSFDVIYCQEVVDDMAAIREFARVTRSGGYVLIRVPAMPVLKGAHDRLVHGARRYVASEMREKLASAGLTPIRLTYANSLLMPLIFIMRRLQSEKAVASDVKPTPSLINHALLQLLRFENYWINHLHKTFPLGVSLFGLARK